MNQQFWNTKKLLERKFGKKEDSSIVASDAELDLKLELFKSIQDSCNNLSNIVEVLKDRMNDLSTEQNNLGRFLRETGKNSSTSRDVMVNSGKVICYVGQQNLTMQASLFRIQQEINTFKCRAIQDSKKTILSMEDNRTKYRAALQMMKSCDLIDPDTGRGLEKYRQAQQYVRFAKSKFDKWSLICLQKIDLLAASRCNLYSYNLHAYCKDFESLNSKNLEVLKSNIKLIEPAKHSFGGVLKDLDGGQEPKKEEIVAKENDGIKDGDQKLFFGDDYSDQPTKKSEPKEQKETEPGKLIDYEKDYFDELMSSSNILMPSQLLLDLDSANLEALGDLMNPVNEEQEIKQEETPQKGSNKEAKSEKSILKPSKKNVNWYDLFSDLDPLSQASEVRHATKNMHAA